jgi:hypothetical protein
MAWGESIDVVLRPNELRLSRRSALTPWREFGARAFSVAPVAQGEAWRASVERLGAALREMRARRASLHVVISDFFVRYALAAWNASLVADSERLAFARLAFRDIYGPPADTWELCLDQQPAGQASLAGAMDRGLLQALRDAAAGQGMRLGSVIPALAARINRHRGAFKGKDFCLAAVEPGRLTLAFHGAAGWLSVRGRRLDGALAQELPAALKQEAAAGAVANGGNLYLAGEELAGLAPFSVPGWRVTRLPENGIRPAAPVASLASAPVAK